MRKTLTGMLAGIGMTLAVRNIRASRRNSPSSGRNGIRRTTCRNSSTSTRTETGVKVTVETTPWPDFQTKAFTEFNAKGGAYDMVVGDCSGSAPARPAATMST